MHRVTNHCDAQTEFFEWTSLQPFHGGDVVTCFDVVGCRERWTTAVGCEVTWGEVMWLVARCHVMWGDVVSCHLMWCDFFFCVMWRDAMWCHVVCPHVMSVICCEVMRRNGMRSHEFVMRCGLLWCHIVWFEVVVWCDELEDELAIRTKKYCKYYTLLQGTTMYYSVLKDTTKYYYYTYYTLLQSTTPYYKVLLQYCKVLLQYYSGTTKYYSGTTKYYSVLQSTTPVLERTTPVLLCTTKYCTTKYYSGTTKYYSVLQSTTPVLQCITPVIQSTPVLLCTTKYYSSNTKYYSSTTKYYSSTTKYYKVLLQYYKVLLRYYKILLQYYSVLPSTTPVPQSTTPVLQSTTPVLQSITPYYRVLCLIVQHMKRPVQCAKQQESPSEFTKYCACHEKWFWWLILVSHETSSTISGATGVTPQPHQILRLPRKMTVMIDPGHTCKVIYIARSNRHHPPTSPNIAPATQNDTHDWAASHMKRHLQCTEQQASPFNLTKCCACHEKWFASLILVTYETSCTMPGATGVIHQRHQELCLPRKMTRIIDPHDISNVIYIAWSNRHHPPTSPNTAPAR